MENLLFLFLGVPILKHIRVFSYYNDIATKKRHNCKVYASDKLKIGLISLVI